jgi:hypothetical protein
MKGRSRGWRERKRETIGTFSEGAGHNGIRA